MIKVIIVDDQHLIAKSLKRVLSSERDIEVVATAHDHQQATRCARSCAHDVILMDIMLGADSGLDVAREIAREVPTTKIIFMSAHIVQPCVAEVLAQQGAGFLSKANLSLEELVDGVREVHRGGRVFSRAALLVVSVLLDGDAQQSIGPLPDDRRPLSARERQVFSLRAAGKSIAAVAEELGVQVATVRTTWERALDKIGIRSEAPVGYVPIPRLNGGA